MLAVAISTLCREHLKGNCTTPSCSCWNVPAKNTKQSREKFGDKCALRHWQAEELPGKKPKKNGDNNSVAILTDARQLGRAFQDDKPPRSSPTLRKSTKVLRPIAHSPGDTREEEGPSLGKLCLTNACGVERCASGEAWSMVQSVFKLKKMKKAGCFSPNEVWCRKENLLCIPEQSMHQVSKNPTTVVTANGEVQSNEEATVYVEE